MFLPLLDGLNDLRDIQAALFRVFGQVLETAALQNLIRILDEHFFLEGDTFNGLLDRETNSPTRPAALAGRAYPDQPGPLAEMLESYFEPRSETGPASPIQPGGLAAPHIDFNRGGPCYASAYRELDRDRPPDVAVILGTAHQPIRSWLAFLNKNIMTPFGPARRHNEILDRLQHRLGPTPIEDIFAHRQEHSVEFQAVWLQGVYRRVGGPAVVPVLCGSFHPLMEDDREPEEEASYEEALEALAELLEEQRAAGRRVLVVASADLSHVGPQFDDDFKVTPEVAEKVRELDLELLRLAVDGDYRSMYARVAATGNQTNVCGVACLYALLRLCGGRAGRLLDYGQWIDENGLGLVSFAGLAFA